MRGDIDSRPIEFGPDGQVRYLPVDVDAFELDSQYMGDLQRIIKQINSMKPGTQIRLNLIAHRNNVENEYKRPELGLKKTHLPKGFIDKVFEWSRGAVTNDRRRKGVELL